VIKRVLGQSLPQLPAWRRDREQVAAGNRHSLPPQMRRDLLRHLSYLEGEDLDPYTFETRRSQYPGVKSDIFVFDGDGRPVIQGRNFHGGPTAFWTLSAPFQQRPQLY
jgi:hypothetical protein